MATVERCGPRPGSAERAHILYIAQLWWWLTFCGWCSVNQMANLYKQLRRNTSPRMMRRGVDESRGGARKRHRNAGCGKTSSALYHHLVALASSSFQRYCIHFRVYEVGLLAEARNWMRQGCGWVPHPTTTQCHFCAERTVAIQWQYSQLRFGSLFKNERTYRANEETQNRIRWLC